MKTRFIADGKIVGRFFFSMVSFAAILFLLPNDVSAATITPTVFTDDFSINGNCSLREAIQAATTNAAVDACAAGVSGLDTVQLAAGTYTLSITGNTEDANATGDIDITGDTLLIQGSGPSTTTILGGGASFNDRLFDVFSGAFVSFWDVTLRGGYVTNDSGAGIYSEGTLNLNRSTITDNHAVSGSSAGGGILALTGSVSISSSTISNNTAAYGSGGFENWTNNASISRSAIVNNTDTGLAGGGIGNYGTMTLTRVTVGGNTAGSAGAGGVYNSIGGALTINFSTIARNTAGGLGGGLGNDGTVTMLGTIVSNNNDTTNLSEDCSGTIESVGYNLFGTTTDCTITGTTTGNILNTDPSLATALAIAPNQAINGISAVSYYPLSTSPVIDTGTNTNCPPTDQRSITAPRIGKTGNSSVCDIGAVEADYAPPTVTLTNPLPTYFRTYSSPITVTSSEIGTLVYSGCSAIGNTSTLITPDVARTIYMNTTTGIYTSCTVAVVDTDGNSSTPIAMPFTVDQVVPLLRVAGSTIVTIPLGGTFTESGVYVWDAINGSTGNSYSTTDRVNSKKAGMYTLAYYGTDAAGNRAGNVNRYVVVRPKISTITLDRGVFRYTYKNVSKTITPFPGYSGAVFARKINYGNTVNYLFIRESNPARIKLYKANGDEAAYYSLTAKVKQLTAPQRGSRNHVALGFDNNSGLFVTTESLWMAVTSVNGATTPSFYEIQRDYISERKAITKSTIFSGNTQGVFTNLESGRLGFVATTTGTADRKKVWQIDGEERTFVELSTYNTHRFGIENGLPTFRAPRLTNIRVGRITDGRMTIRWTTDRSSNSTVKYGSTKAVTGGKVVVSAVVREHAVQIPAVHGSTVYFTLTSCRPSLTAAIGCTTAKVRSILAI